MPYHVYRLLPLPRLTLTVNRQKAEAEYIGKLSSYRKKGLTKERMDDMVAAYRDGFSSALEMLSALGFLKIGE